MSLAEKFQITTPYRDAHDDGEQWATIESCRESSEFSETYKKGKLNWIPQNDLMNNGVEPTDTKFARGYGGNTDVSGERVFASPDKLFKEGYARLDMKATDDQYSGEHVDLFYGDAVDEAGNVGFSERNNYLDRL